MPMKGWKTWVAVVGMVALGVVDLVNGQIDGALLKFTGAAGLIGLGGKIERNGR